MTDCDVAVVGLGPTGAVLANLLGLLGLDVVVFERDTDLHDLPRAVHFDGEVMRVFQTIGVARAVAEVSRINQGMRFVDRQGRTLLDWPRPQQAGPQGWHPSWRFHQPDLDRALRARLTDWPSVEVRLGHAVTSAAQQDGGALLTCQGPDGAYQVRAAYAVGCDGARSTVRAAIGGEAEDLGFHERWLVADLVLARERPDLGDVTLQHCHPERAASPMSAGRDCGGAGRSHCVRKPMRRPWTQPICAPGWPRGWTPTRQPSNARRSIRFIPSSPGAGAMAVFCWRATRPIRHRPSWDRASAPGCAMVPIWHGNWPGVFRHGHDETLLSTYQTERHPNVRTFIQRAVDLGRLINASDPGAALREAFTGPDGTPTMASPAPALGPPITAGDATHSGQLFAQPELDDGRRLDDIAGYGFAMVTDQPASRGQLAGARAAGIAIASTRDHPALGAGPVGSLGRNTGHPPGPLHSGNRKRERRTWPR